MLRRMSNGSPHHPVTQVVPALAATEIPKQADSSPPFAERLVAMIFGLVFLMIFALFAVTNATGDIGQKQFFIIQVILAVGGAAFAAVIPGYLAVSARTFRGVGIRAGGATAVFAILVPFGLPKDPDEERLLRLVGETDRQLAYVQAAALSQNWRQATDAAAAAKRASEELLSSVQGAFAGCKK